MQCSADRNSTRTLEYFISIHSIRTFYPIRTRFSCVYRGIEYRRIIRPRVYYSNYVFRNVTRRRVHVQCQYDCNNYQDERGGGGPAAGFLCGGDHRSFLCSRHGKATGELSSPRHNIPNKLPGRFVLLKTRAVDIIFHIEND